MNKLPLDPNTEIWSWGPTPFRLLYGDWFDGIFRDFRKEYPGYQWPEHGLSLSKDRRFVFLFELPELYKQGKKLFLNEMLPKDRREKSRAKWEAARVSLDEIKKKIESIDLQSLSDEELKKLWKEFHKCVSAFWCFSNLPELANLGSTELLEEHLRPLVPTGEIATVMETLTAPEDLSFYQQEELALAETDDVKAHHKKCYWIKNSYAQVGVCPEADFVERKKLLSPLLRTELLARIEEVKKKKQEIKEKYGLSQEIMDIAEAITDAIVWQDERKGEIWKYLHDCDLLASEVARRYKVSKDDLLNLLSEEVSDLMEGKYPEVDFAARRKAYGVALIGTEYPVIGTQLALKYWNLYLGSKANTDIREFKGIIACKGKAKGRVRIVLDAHNPGEFNDGDVLVTSMTSPEYVFIMKKAGAVLTDTGGLTSHAAIVSRELGVPCLVGTKVATHVLKDGDMVEVDAEKGIVRKLS